MRHTIKIDGLLTLIHLLTFHCQVLGKFLLFRVQCHSSADVPGRCWGKISTFSVIQLYTCFSHKLVSIIWSWNLYLFSYSSGWASYKYSAESWGHRWSLQVTPADLLICIIWCLTYWFKLPTFEFFQQFFIREEFPAMADLSLSWVDWTQVSFAAFLFCIHLIVSKLACWASYS